MTYLNLTEKEQKARERLCLPLDGLKTIDEIQERVQELSPVVGLFKIGKASYTRFGPLAVNVVRAYGGEVFLDLKYHDIPETVKDAAMAATEQGVSMFNVHAFGGVEMMKAAVKGVSEAKATKMNNLTPPSPVDYIDALYCVPKVLGVTVLTSIDQSTMNNELHVPGKVEDQVFHLAQLSTNAGLDGIVCSALDLPAIRDRLPANFTYVTPGIQGPNTSAGADQKRVCTPSMAIQNGASILVVGRAITSGKTPEQRLQNGYEILQDMAKDIDTTYRIPSIYDY